MTLKIHGPIDDTQVLRAVVAIARAKRVGIGALIVDIDSEGGYVKGARRIATAIKNAALPVSVVVTGQCASAANEILACGHFRSAVGSASFMLHKSYLKHNALTVYAWGPRALRRVADQLDESDNMLIRDLRVRGVAISGQVERRYCAGQDVYLTPTEAKQINLIHSIED